MTNTAKTDSLELVSETWIVEDLHSLGITFAVQANPEAYTAYVDSDLSIYDREKKLIQGGKRFMVGGEHATDVNEAVWEARLNFDKALAAHEGHLISVFQENQNGDPVDVNVYKIQNGKLEGHNLDPDDVLTQLLAQPQKR